MAGWVEPVSVAGIYLARIVELRTKRDTLPGPVRETRTLQWFVAIGTLMLGGGLGELLWRKPEWNAGTFVLGWTCGLASFGIRRSSNASGANQFDASLRGTVLAHRLLLSSQTRLRGRTAIDVLDEIVREVPVPVSDPA